MRSRPMLNYFLPEKLKELNRRRTCLMGEGWGAALLDALEAAANAGVWPAEINPNPAFSN